MLNRKNINNGVYTSRLAVYEQCEHTQTLCEIGQIILVSASKKGELIFVSTVSYIFTHLFQ